MTATAKKFNAEDYASTFDDLLSREQAGTVSKPTTMGTLVELAKANGYRPMWVESGAAVQTSEAANDEGGVPGDIRAGRFYAKAKRGKLMYARAAGLWMMWGGTVWEWCNKGEEELAAKSVADKILALVTEKLKADPDRYKRDMHWAIGLQHANRLAAMISLAKSEEGMTLGHMSELDADPMLLGVRNGVVDLRTGALLAPDPAMLITRQCNAEYDRSAQCPTWEKFLADLFPGDPETVEYLRRALGYSLTGNTGEEVMFICYGHGANGKSVFSNVVSSILGGYAQAAPPSLLTVRQAGDAGPRNDIARLCGARYLGINETGQGDRLDEQVVKMLAGREPISARYLHKEFFDFVPTSKAWLRTNHRPIVTGEDDGIWRRLHLIPFRRQFAEHERDPKLEEKLLAERGGILAWMVEGCLECRRIGLKWSPTVCRESAAYRTESDLLGEFLDDKTLRGADARVVQVELFAAWRTWNEGNGTSAGSKASFSRKLTERGIGTNRSNGARFYTGLTLRGGAR